MLARNEILRTAKQFGEATWKRWSGYHRRSRVGAKAGRARWRQSVLGKEKLVPPGICAIAPVRNTSKSVQHKSSTYP